jgi:hypothetical protein
MPMVETATVYRGWWRPSRRAPWVCLARAASLAEAWSDLLQALELQQRHGGDSTVRRGDDPPANEGRRP